MATSNIERGGSVDEVTEAVRGLLPMLRDNALEAERQRQLPRETIEALDAAGVFRLFFPREYGGLAATAREQFDVVADIASACGSTAWVVQTTGTAHPGVLLYSHAVCEEVLGSSWVGPRVCSRLIPQGTGRAADGGWLVNGTWNYVSGVTNGPRWGSSRKATMASLFISSR
jgi:3-hydroxy-9,10-secoandrosta-1,3,5(10)-triene-9,17-dione monooxygenase